MRTLWTILSTLAVANLLALLGVAGWLKATDRISADRLEKIRLVLARPVAQERAEAERTEAESRREAEAAAEKAKEGSVPLSSGDLLRVKLQLSEADRKRVEAMESEVSNLRQLLSTEREALDAERTRLESEKAAFAAMREDIVKKEGDRQFRKALATYEGLKPDEAKQVFQQLITEKKTDDVVSYLNAMDEDQRTKIVAVFVEEDPRVAADLLERLRTRGMVSRGSGLEP